MLTISSARATARPCANRSFSVAPKPRLRVKAAFMGEQVDVAGKGKFDFKQAERIKVGDTLPMDEAMLVLDEGASEPKSITLKELVGNKKAVLFGLPGAFTSVCSSKHVPNYVERSKELANEGVQVIACLSVNDPWVMRDWAKNLGVDTSVVHMMADGEGILHSKLGLLQHMPGLGLRALRYSMLVDNGKVVVLNVEEPGGKSYKISGPGHMLEDLANLKGQ
ncbi:peroxiredoxin-like protein [Scenedesmus sp. NREL 46B-D3]|nr:peroxiredoxin-like protein [Scenedesmus sp. NREL 46B-D3]